MSNSGDFFHSFDDGYLFQPSQAQSIPRINTQHSTSHGYHPASTGPWAASQASADDSADLEDGHALRAPLMDWEITDHLDAGPGSLSNSPNSIFSPNDDASIAQGWLDLGLSRAQFKQDTPPRTSSAVRTDVFAHTSREQSVVNYQHASHIGQPLPSMPYENHWQSLMVHTTIDHLQTPFSPVAQNYIDADLQQGPWTFPRQEIQPTSEVVILDPESDARSASYSPGTVPEDILSFSPTLSYHDLPVDHHSPHSDYSMKVTFLPSSPLDHLSLPQAITNQFVDHRQLPVEQMLRSDSIYSRDSYETHISTPPAMSNQPSHNGSISSHVSYQLVSPVKPDPVYNYESSHASASPGASFATITRPDILEHELREAPSISPRDRSLDYMDDGPSTVATNTLHNNSRSGGRLLGSHLQPAVAADANMMRKVVACWRCVLQRDKCGPGDTCERCRKRSLRPNAEYGLGCSRTSLRDLMPLFLPSLMTSIHDPDVLMKFCKKHVKLWEGEEINIQLACGHDLPVLRCHVYEFRPLDKELLRSHQYIPDSKTGQLIRVERWSPPLGIQQQNLKEESQYERYISGIVEHHLAAFSEMFFARDPNGFAARLFQLLMDFKPTDSGEKKTLKDVFRLVVVTYIMSRVFIIADPDRDSIFRRLKSYKPNSYPEFCSPRMANRQQLFRSSGKGAPRWTEAFCAVLGLAIANEEVQKGTHVTMDAKAAAGEVTKQVAVSHAEEACKEIDQKFTFIMNIFTWKYNRGSENPLRDFEKHDWSPRLLKDRTAVGFVRKVVCLVQEYHGYLQERQYVEISHKSPHGTYTSRLVARFLLAFWHPS